MVSQVIASTHCYSLVSNEKKNEAMEPGRRMAQRERNKESRRESTQHKALSLSSGESLSRGSHYSLATRFHNEYTLRRKKQRTTRAWNGEHSRTRRCRITLVVTRHEYPTAHTQDVYYERSTLDDGRVSTNQPQSRGEAFPSPSPAPSPATPSHCLPRHHVVSPLLVFPVSLVLIRPCGRPLSFSLSRLRQSAS